LTSETDIFGSNPRAGQAVTCASSEWFGLARVTFAFLVVFTVLFFSPFSSPAHAHGMHGTKAAQLSELTVKAAVPDTDTTKEKVSDDADGECGSNCCSMSGCGYAPHRLPQLFAPITINSVGHVFNYLPWVENPLDTLQRPPRSLS
jgi:hypothetical protein